MAQLHANNDNTWSVTASSEEEALLYVAALDNCLSHPDLDTPEKVEAWIAAQQSQSDEER